MALEQGVHAVCLSDLPQGGSCLGQPHQSILELSSHQCQPSSEQETDTEARGNLLLKCGRDPSATGKDGCLRWCGQASQCGAGPGAEAASHGFGCLGVRASVCCLGPRLQSSHAW